MLHTSPPYGVPSYGLLYFSKTNGYVAKLKRKKIKLL